jgi:hypothetical protein
MDKQGPRDVDAYIASAPAAAQPHLRTLRAIVKSEAPGAEERLSTLRFAFDRPLPIAALHAAVRARVDQNEAPAPANSRRPAR